MKWDRELELCIPVEICDINCRPGFNKKDCECKTIYSENECNAQKGTMWDKNTKKCEAEKRCPAETCPDKSPMSPKNGCKCECEEGTSWDPEAQKCTETVYCKGPMCKVGYARSIFDCECKPNKESCDRGYPKYKWDIDDSGNPFCSLSPFCESAIRCPHWMNLGMCKCDDVVDKRECLSRKATFWDDENEKCQEQKVCPAVLCREGLGMTQDCECLECDTGMVWNHQEAECQKPQACIEMMCPDG